MAREVFPDHFFFEWAMRDSNPRPSRHRRDALNQQAEINYKSLMNREAPLFLIFFSNALAS